jgi:hypothetical protein
MVENKLGYSEFSENILYMLPFDSEFILKNDTLLKDLIYTFWEDYVENDNMTLKNYVKIFHITVDKISQYGLED